MDKTNNTQAVDAGARDENDAFEAYYASKGRPVYGNMKAAMRMTWLDARTSEATANEPPYAYEIGSRDRTLELVYPAYLERHATDEERALPRLALYTAPPAASGQKLTCMCSGLGPCEKHADGSCRLLRDSGEKGRDLTDEQIVNIADSYSFTWDEGIIAFARALLTDSATANDKEPK